MSSSKEYTTEQEEEVIRMFFRTDLEEGECKIDNSSVTISNRTGINIQTVNKILDNELKERSKNYGKQ